MMPDYSDYTAVSKLLEDAQDAEQDQRALAKEAHVFVTAVNGQWEQGWWDQNDGKPRYTFDQTSPIIDQIAGDIEASDFDIQIKPAGRGATKDLAELRDGLIRNIETISDAQTIYAIAGRNVATAGFDAWRVSTGFVNDDSFDQDILIEPIHNSIDRVWFDVGSQKQDRSDSNYGFMLSVIPVEQFKEKWPDRTSASVSDGSTNDTTYYNKVDNVVIGHVYYRKLIGRTLVKTSLGRVFERNADFENIEDELAQGGETVVDERDVKDSVFYVRKFDGNDWLDDEQETVFSSIPLVPVYGNFKVIENKPVYHGVVQKLMDPQRVLNYSLSREIEEGALAPRAKTWMTEKQAAGHEDTLRTQNTNSNPIQLYNADPAAPPPSQGPGAQINPGLRVISDGMQSIMGRTAGIFAAGMGDNPGLQSGVAIDKLQTKSNNITSKYFKSLEIAVCRTGKLISDALSKVYDANRVVRIMGEDGSSDMEMINQMVVDQETGEPVLMNDLSAGKYDVTCTAGPSFSSRQSETVDAILNVAAVDPSIIGVGSDILLNNMSAPGMNLVAERKRAQLLNEGVIPEGQLTDDERAQLQQAAQNPQPDAMMVAAQAEQAKADADMQKNQIEAARLQGDQQIKTEELRLKGVELELKGREQELKIAEKSAGLNLDADNQAFKQMMDVAAQNSQAINDAVNNLNTHAGTLKLIHDAMTPKGTIITPSNTQAYDEQAQEVLDAQDTT